MKLTIRWQEVQRSLSTTQFRPLCMHNAASGTCVPPTTHPHTPTHTQTQTQTRARRHPHRHTQTQTETHTQRHTVTCNGLEWSSNSHDFLQQLDRVHRCIPKPRIVAIHSPTCLNLTCILGTFKHKVQPCRTAITESDSILQSPM